MITLRPAAKINLTLRVGAARADGFHDVQTLMQSIDLRDTLTAAPRPGAFRFSCRAAEVPADRGNLVWRAADALWRALRRPGDPRGASLVLRKGIPSGAGLGGGSADAAAALVALNRIWRGGLTVAALIDLAAGLGSDVAFFLHGGTAIGSGRGEVVYPVDDVARRHLVLIKPAVSVATPDAYRWLDRDRAVNAAGATSSRWLDAGWPTGPIQLVNDLEMPVARRVPVVAEMVEACLSAGASVAAMTGSGSAVFAVFGPGQAARAARRLRRPGWQVLAVRTLTRRESRRAVGL